MTQLTVSMLVLNQKRVCLPKQVKGLLYSPQGPLLWPRDYHHSLLSWLNRKINIEDLLLNSNSIGALGLDLLVLRNECWKTVTSFRIDIFRKFYQLETFHVIHISVLANKDR